MKGKKIQKKVRKPAGSSPAAGGPKVLKNFTVPSWAVYALLVFTAMLYMKALFNGFVIWDDNEYIMFNPMLHDFSLHGLKHIFTSFHSSGNYHPLTIASNLVEFRLFGLNPLPYHFVNLLLHLLNTWLVYRFAEKLSGRSLTAIIVAALFAIHPMHVESVAWASERKDLLYTLFYILALTVWLDYLKPGRQALRYAGVLLLFFLSLLSKSAAVTLPVLLIAVDLYRGRKISLPALADKVPFFLLSVAFGLINMYAQRAVVNQLPLSYTLSERLFMITYSVAFYLVKLVLPFNLSAMHYYPNTLLHPLGWEYYASLPFLLLIGGLMLVRTSFRRELVFGIFFFLISISVMIQLIPFGFALVAERYSYVPYIGLFYIIGQFISGLDSKAARNGFLAVLGVFLALFSYLTWERIGVWKDGISLFSDVILKNPDTYHGYFIRGIIRSDNGDLKGGIEDLSRSADLNPGFANGFRTRGYLYNRMEDFPDALKDLDKAIRLDSTFAEAWLNRGIANDALGHLDDAMRDYNKAISMDPKLAKAYDNRGVLKAKAGDLKGAAEDINRAISLFPGDAGTYSNRGNLRALQKDYKGSVEDFTEAIRLKPDNGRDYFNRALSKMSLKDTAGACLDFKKSAELGHQMASRMLQKYCK